MLNKYQNNQQRKITINSQNCFQLLVKRKQLPRKKASYIFYRFKWAVGCLDRQLLLNVRGAAKANPLSLFVFSFGKPCLSFKANRFKDNDVKAAKSFS
jgi:hypothetical protein